MELSQAAGVSQSSPGPVALPVEGRRSARMPMAQPDLQVTERLFKPLHWNSVCLHICRDLRMVFFCSETLLYMTVILDVLILSFMTFSKSQHKVEETK